MLHLPDDHPALTTQQLVLDVINSGRATCGIYAADPALAPRALADARALANRILTYATTEQLSAVVPADLLDAYTTPPAQPTVSLECGSYQKIALTASFRTFRAGLVPLAIPVDEPVVIRYEILLDDRKVFDEDVASESGGRDVALPINGAGTMTLAVECQGGQSSGSLSWAGFENAGFT